MQNVHIKGSMGLQYDESWPHQTYMEKEAAKRVASLQQPEAEWPLRYNICEMAIMAGSTYQLQATITNRNTNQRKMELKKKCC